VSTLLVRRGVDARKEPQEGRHVLVPVYIEMMMQCCRDYPGLPDVRTLTMSQIEVFYDWLRPGLKQATKPKPNK
jgi:hypothetical protein